MYIDDSAPSPDKTYSSQKIEQLLNEKSNLAHQHAASLFYEDWLETEEVIVEYPPLVVTASPEEGNYEDSVLVTLSSNRTADIFYTTDGSAPSTSSTVYTAPIPITKDTTLAYFALAPDGHASTTQTRVYSITPSDSIPPVVTASPRGNASYNTAQNVILAANEPATIYYTTNGSTPTHSSAIYSSPIPIGVTTNLKYMAKDAAGNTSPVYSYWYVIDQAPPQDVTSLSYTNVGSSKARLSWRLSASADVTHYEVFEGSRLVARTKDKNTAYVDLIGLSPATEYSFTVKAKDGAKNYSSGMSVTFTTFPQDTAPKTYVTNGLLVYEENVPGSAFLPPRDIFFDRSAPFTVAFTVRSRDGATYLKMYDAKQDHESTVSVVIKRNYNPNPQFVAAFFATDSLRNAVVYPNLFSSPFDTEKEYHVVVVRDTSAFSLYIDDKLVSQSNYGSSVHIDKFQQPLIQIGDKIFPVFMRHLAYYNRALTRNELTRNYNEWKT